MQQNLRAVNDARGDLWHPLARNYQISLILYREGGDGYGDIQICHLLCPKSSTVATGFVTKIGID